LDPELVGEHHQTFQTLAAGVSGLRGLLSQARAREALLDSHPSQGSAEQYSIQVQNLIETRESVLKSALSANQFLEQALLAKETLSQQNSALRRAGDRTTTVVRLGTDAKSLMHSIWRQTTKQTVILGTLGGFSLAGLIWWYLSKTV